MKTLVTGGIRSGKSSFAEGLLPENGAATYIATGGVRDDSEWQARIDAHRRRRPSLWNTVETLDVQDALAHARGPMLLDDIGNWLSRTLDELGAWDGGPWRNALEPHVQLLLDAVAAYPDDVVIVTSEVGFGLVAPYQSGRLFTDELGRLNQRLASLCARVVLVVSGCPLAIKGDLL